ncbi:hypothetical protein [Streptomyces sp. NPDC001083]|uniref:hypothetical protein n=1 Tax=Streptomyces sp. NPDC001083 TaxID=3364545 RepID=UPI0036A59FB9
MHLVPPPVVVASGPAVSNEAIGNRAKRLLSEDRQEYEQIVDEALRSDPFQLVLAAAGRRLNSEQLRTMALNATALITAAAMTEYGHYVNVREGLRRPEPSAAAAGVLARGGSRWETAGAKSAVAVFAVLAPVLAGTAAAICLLVGYLLKVLAPGQTFARNFLAMAWVFGAATAAAVLVAAVGLLVTALRSGPSSLQAGARGELDEEVDRAREAWRDALLERGIMPFLQQALVDSGPQGERDRSPSAPAGGRMPRLGYSRPGFSSPDESPTAGPRPGMSSPDFTSPDFGGPEHEGTTTDSD